MRLFNSKLNTLFNSRQVIKVIAGLDNSNMHNILKIVKAAELSNATYIDTIANTYIIKKLKSISSLPICASSISPIDLYNCVVVGADLVELGNFDSFYKQKIYLSLSNVLELAKETISLIGNIDICVTIPYYLHLQDQIKLARELEAVGVNIIQTEGIPTFNKNYSTFVPDSNLNLNDYIFSSLNLSCLPLSSAYILSNYVNIPIITSSKMNCLSSSMANFYGSSGIGIGSKISQKSCIQEMSSYIDEVRQSLKLINCQRYLINDMESYKKFSNYMSSCISVNK
uniref:Uncharacterized protein ycf23 n=1 Tax=Osmundaria fimbriata TaxID=228265 RepID=A0A1Z1M4P7_OSMFI|nr:hypothetical protein [Osmundaria fimbriata]ARW60775.1 hypothetical protein [Osmundaria fimbriata]